MDECMDGRTKVSGLAVEAGRRVTRSPLMEKHDGAHKSASHLIERDVQMAPEISHTSSNNHPSMHKEREMKGYRKCLNCLNIILMLLLLEFRRRIRMAMSLIYTPADIRGIFTSVILAVSFDDSPANGSAYMIEELNPCSRIRDIFLSPIAFRDRNPLKS
ncbi:hypothetical protein AVEN_218679-1 [Araneus ventricosus]|uniref:Uncharacterized protein n=1 Tax=Araneus ventricosus TaxID=182803 RepID=A0A4Y2B417_ARAVE|nr:hypothetical protein AVEN_218679-1 [Araneus ventricosus]